MQLTLSGAHQGVIDFFTCPTQGNWLFNPFSLKVKYDLSDFNVLTYLKNLERSAMLDSYATNIVYLESLILFIKAKGKELPEI